MIKRGFTLIELLAVIVILAIIALIATPIVLKIINSTKESSAERSLELYEESVANAVARYQLKTGHILLGEYSTTDDGKKLYLKSDVTKTPIEGFLIEYSGSTVSCETINVDLKGKIQYDNCKVSNKIVTSTTETNSTPSGSQKICRRASTLHTEVCMKTSTTEYCSGAGYKASGSKGTTTITYGSLGTSGTLISGDAFDCDVNGDGTYNSETERFYYVSGKDGNNTSEYVTLIYYNNTSGGIHDNTSTSRIAYDSTYHNRFGPRTAIAKLPSTTDWTNVISDTPHSIKNESGGNTSGEGILPISFNYSEYAARLLTIQEVNKACNIIIGSYVDGELDNCNYLMENTKYSTESNGTYGYWLENPISTNASYAWIIKVKRRIGGSGSVDDVTQYGVRPAIVISKSDISY